MFKGHDLESSTATDQYGNGIVPATALLNHQQQYHHNQHNNKNGDALTEANGTKTVPYSATGANGSIITMTLKNNHLIVETEERSVSATNISVLCQS